MLGKYVKQLHLHLETLGRFVRGSEDEEDVEQGVVVERGNEIDDSFDVQIQKFDNVKIKSDTGNLYDCTATVLDITEKQYKLRVHKDKKVVYRNKRHVERYMEYVDKFECKKTRK